MRHGAFVAGNLPIDALLVRIAPAGMHPDFGIHADKLAVERLGEEFEVCLGTVGPQRASVMRRFLHLDQRAAGSGQVA